MNIDLDIIIWNDFEGFIDGYELPKIAIARIPAEHRLLI